MPTDCGCETRGDRTFLCPYHQGREDERVEILERVEAAKERTRGGFAYRDDYYSDGDYGDGVVEGLRQVLDILNIRDKESGEGDGERVPWFSDELEEKSKP